jgi:glycosyltransferase involved in cell wall biosynthesis
VRVSTAPADVVVLVPVLRRPHRVQPLVQSIRAATERCDILFIATDGDHEEIEAVQVAAKVCPFVSFEVIDPNPVGDYAYKINRAYQITENPYLFFGADDLHFHPGWLPAALGAMAEPGVGVVGTQDLANRRVLKGLHATHSLVSREYIDECGTIDEHGKALHEGYAHEFVDDEFVQTAIFRGAFVFAEDSIVEHLHPCVRKAPLDDLYRAEPHRMQQGRVLFNRRRPLWTSR